jgi:hypothetical protein
MNHPFQPKCEYAFTIGIELTTAKYLKPTNVGMTRVAIYAASGTVEGPLLRGKVIPMSGGDFALVRADGVIDFDARYLLEAEDGTVIYLQNRGFRWHKTPEVAAKISRNEPVSDDDYYMRLSPKFDVPDGPHAWMNKYVFVGVAEKLPGANRIHYFVIR